MSLDVVLTATRPTSVFDYNITHNLGKMAEAAGIYQYLWRPEELNITTAGELIEPLTKGLQRLKNSPDHFRTFEPDNGWGSYDGLVKIQDLVDKMFSGFYIISAINHYVTRERHECNIELIKDSLQLDINRKK